MQEQGGVAMLERECANCGERIVALAGACPHCGAPNRGRPAGMMVAGALALPLVAIVVAMVVVLRGDRLAAATETGAPADEHIAARSTTDPSWLATAMSECDAQARTDRARLLFLVTPLAVVAQDIAPWRAKSINDMGNGMLLRADDTLAGLKNGTLRFYPADYDFRMLDQAGDMVYKWRPSAGVTKLSAADAGAIATFKVQFRTARGGKDAEWGGSFNRQVGACHWVNAIIGN
jgi:hypothetical protein